MPRAALDRAAHIGQRDALILIEKLSESQGDSNFPTESWVQAVQVWASRDYVTLDERVQSSQLMASAVVRFEVPYSYDIDPDVFDVPNKRRVNFKNRIYNIIAAEMRPRSEGRSIVLTTQAKVG